MHRTHRSAVLAAAALITVAAALPARAAHRDPAPSGGALFLTVTGSEGDWTRGVRLRCAPEPAGPHPDAAGACAAIAAAGGDLDRLPADPHPCTKRFDPVTARATGDGRDRTAEWTRTYPNACALDAATGAVFRF
ncbi:SSI family serine proteinase inhibitor [Streptomyces sp. NPDC051018]|uniref:SSI family serine proteinase inhibitor n=1 Tax=Streptomyces sp. NPDC051018 TaxID=3365639 RepID=UPI0037AEE9FA